MTTVALVLAAVSLAGVVLLAFGYAASLTLIKELQDKLHDAAVGDAPRQLGFFARDRLSFVLVTEQGCLACTDRTADFAHYVAERPGSSLSFTVLHAGTATRPAGLPISVEYVGDPEIVAKVGAGIMPLGLVYDRSGTEVGRSVLGDVQSLERLLGWAEQQQKGSSVIDPQLAGRD